MRGISRIEAQWGTVITLDVRDDIDPEVVESCFAWFRRVDELFSTWRSDSEIMQLARGTLARDDASPEVGDVLALCEQMRLESHGAFDIEVGALPNVEPCPGRAPIDPSGLVKGWAIGRAGEVLRASGATSFFVSAGGDLVTGGRPDDTRATWRVGIQHPWDRQGVAAVIETNDAAVATSGRYERGEHIIDPRTGHPVAGLASVTVVGPDLALADAYATAALVLGPADGMRWLATRVGYEALSISDDRVVTTTPGFDRYRVPSTRRSPAEAGLRSDG